MANGSVIGLTTVVRGDLRGESSIEILGRVEGGVDVDGDVTLGEGAVVLGGIRGANLTIRGAVRGDLRGTAAVVVENAAKVVGDLSAPRLAIAEGALVKGAVRTDGEPDLPKAAPPRKNEAARAQSAPRAAGARREGTKPAAKPATRRAKPAAKKGSSKKRPPPPVVPALRRGAKAKKKKARRR